MNVCSRAAVALLVGALFAAASSFPLLGAVALAQAPVAAPQSKPGRPPDFVLEARKCVQLSSKVAGGKSLKIEALKGRREACWRTADRVSCQVGDGMIELRVNRESGPRLFLTGDAGLVMTELDWSTGNFASGITFHDDAVGIAHVQCAGRVLAGAAAQK